MRACLLLFLFCSTAATAETPYIAVVEKVAGAVGFYSENGKELAQVKVGPFPHEAVLSPDGRYLYVSCNGVLWMTEDTLGHNTIAVVDGHAFDEGFAAFQRAWNPADPPPAITVHVVAGLGPEFLVEIDAIAVV